MPTAKPSSGFARLIDGTILIRQADGSFQPCASETDRLRLSALSEAEIEHFAANDPYHPALDESFWDNVEQQPPSKEAISIKLDRDVLTYFRGQGRGYQTRINAVLRLYVDARLKERR